MYRCTRCRSVVPASQSAHHVVTEIRRKEYAPSVDDSRRAKRKKKKRGGGEARPSQGWEAVRSDVVCSRCLPEAEAHFAAQLASLGVEPPAALS